MVLRHHIAIALTACFLLIGEATFGSTAAMAATVGKSSDITFWTSNIGFLLSGMAVCIERAILEYNRQAKGIAGVALIACSH